MEYRFSVFQFEHLRDAKQKYFSQMARDISARIHKDMVCRLACKLMAFMESRLNAVPFRYGIDLAGLDAKPRRKEVNP